MLLSRKFSRSNEYSFLEETIIFGKAEDRLFWRAFLFRGDAERLCVVLAIADFGEFDEVLRLIGGVE